MILKTLRLKILSFLALAVLFTQTASASERIPRPIFNQERRFVVSTTQEATPLNDQEIPLDILFFNRASQSCGLSGEDALSRLRTLFRQDSSLWSTLDKLFPNSRKLIQDKKVTLLIDDFTDFAGARPDFASYFVNLNGKPVVGISCGALFKYYWLPSLAHEFTHALFDGRQMELWWEEGLAQNIESEIGGEQPDYTLKHLHSFPSLLETRRPLPSKESYAINQLFVRYLKINAGGWPLLQAMSGNNSAVVTTFNCEQESDFLSRLACRGKIFLESATSSFMGAGGLMTADKMTRSGLLRYFSVAMTLNDAKTDKYFISQWQGLQLPSQPSLQSLESGQFEAWTAANFDPQSFNPNLELYRILSDGNGKFVILPRDLASNKGSLLQAKAKLGDFKKNFFLILNPGLRSENLK